MLAVRPSQSAAYAASLAARHRSEVEYVVNTCFPDPQKAERYFQNCAEHRTPEQVETLRNDARELWRTRLRQQPTTQ